MELQYGSVTVLRPSWDEQALEVHVHGKMPRWLMDQALDEAKRQIGTYEETPLEKFCREQEITINIYPTRDEDVARASIEASYRIPGNHWSLKGCSTEGRTPAEARRNLAVLISGKTIVIGSMLPIARDIRVPDLDPAEQKQH